MLRTYVMEQRPSLPNLANEHMSQSKLKLTRPVVSYSRLVHGCELGPFELPGKCAMSTAICPEVFDLARGYSICN